MDIQILISVLLGLAALGLSYVILKAFTAGSQAYSGAYSEKAARQLEDIFLFIPPKRLEDLRWSAAGVVFIFSFMMFGSFSSTLGIAIGIIVSLITSGLTLNFPSFVFQILKIRRREKFNVQLVDTLLSISNSLKAGFSISQAIEAIVKQGENPMSQEFDLFLQQTRVGVNFSDALTNMEERIGSDDFTLVVRAIETARKTGGNLTEILQAISGTIRERMRIETRIKTLTAQGRLQGIIIGGMPVVIFIALMITDPQTMRPFVHSPQGIGIMAVVVLLVAIGAVIIRKIIKIDI